MTKPPSSPPERTPPESAEGESAEQHQVRVDLDVIRASQVDAEWDEPRAEEVPVLGPEHELHDEAIPVLGPEHELHDEAIPVLSPEDVVIDEAIPVLGPEHELRDEAIPVLGPENVVLDEVIPVLGPEHAVHDEAIPVLGPEHALHDEAIPVLGLENVVADDAIPVLGPEHELSDEEVPGEIPSARVVGYVEPESESEPEPDPDAVGGDPDLAVLLPDREPPPSESETSDRAAPEKDEEATEEVSEEPAAAADADDEADAEIDESASRNYRQIYENELKQLERDARVALAHTADNPILFALCLDPEPQVINAVFENSHAGLEHARMAATHHKNPVGLEFIVRRADFLRDTQTQRLLLRNSQLTESLMRRVLTSKPLHEVYRVCINRDIPDRNRTWSRGILRSRFSKSQPEERANLVISTEGRCLTFMVGQTFDARTTQILCGRPYNSVLFIQNLARFPACPPALLMHLLKQPFVKRHAAVKRMLMQHPNLPSQAKRGM